MSTSTDQNPTFSFPDIGVYPVSFTVTLPNGQTGTVRRKVIIFELITTAFTSALDGCGTTVTFTDTSSVTETIASWTWNFGDGSPVSHLQNPTHLYLLDDTYSVTLTIRTTGGGIGTFTDDVEVEAVAETVTSDFTFVDTGLDVDFTDTSTTSTGIVEWFWDFGDGNTSTDQNPSHTFNADGTYTVGLEVTGLCGTIDALSQDVTVSAFIEPILGKGDSNAATISTDGRVFTTSNFQSNPPTWTANNISASTDTIIDAVIDPFSPYFLTGSGNVNAYLITSGSYTNSTLTGKKVKYLTDIYGSRTVSTLYTVTGDTPTLLSLAVSRKTPNTVALSYRYFSGASNRSAIASMYNGGSWVQTDINSENFAFNGGVVISPTTETIYAMQRVTSGATFYAHIFSSSFGGSFADTGTNFSTVVVDGASMYMTFNNDTDIYVSAFVSGTRGYTYFNTSDISPSDTTTATKMGQGGQGNHPISSYIGDDNIMYMIGFNAPGSPTYIYEAFYSTDGGTTWNSAYQLTNSNSPVTMNTSKFAENDPDTIFVLGNSFLGYSETLTTLTNKATGTIGNRKLVAVTTK